MKLDSAFLHPYAIPYKTGLLRSGALVQIMGKSGKQGWGEVSPLPSWSQETLKQALAQWESIKPSFLSIDWTEDHFLETLHQMNLLPSLAFGLESALFSLFKPFSSSYSVETSALLMGTLEEIFQTAEKKHQEGFSSAKIKISQLPRNEAHKALSELKNLFRLRVDVNQAWTLDESLRFFSKYPQDSFEYIEEPVKDPQDLPLFSHPFALDESWRRGILPSNDQPFPLLKAIIYKPMLGGGLAQALPLHHWTTLQGLSLVLSSSFESSIGLACIAAIAHHLKLSSPIGIGTYDYLEETKIPPPLFFSGPRVHIPIHLPSRLLKQSPGT